MILVLGGTTEGRKCVEVLDQGDSQYFYSTRGTLQEVNCIHGKHISGSMTTEDMVQFCKTNAIKLIVDAAHPFASELHATVNSTSNLTGIPVVRYERQYPTLPEQAIACDGYEDAISKMRREGVKKLLALTGVQTIAKLRKFWEETPTVFRILKREESLEKAEAQGFPKSNVVFYADKSTTELINLTNADAIITKQSGESGGISDKMEAAVSAGVKIFVVNRPEMPREFITVTGKHGLRKMVEKHCLGFFKLRSGFTTGACATAAAKTAMQLLLYGDYSDTVKFALPDGEIMEMPIKTAFIHQGKATAIVVKDAGDDPDVTNGQEIHVTLEFNGTNDIKFIGGSGIGTVTLPGTGLEIGEPAINPVPREMITHELRNLYSGGVDVTISMPNGEEIAKKTFNSRIGIVNGISIIGTTGIVMPFSNEAFLDAIRKQIKVAQAIGVERIVINSGARSERIVKQAYPSLPSQAFIHYGNAIGETIKLAAEMGVKKLTIGIMIGKAVKLAEGHLDTHSHNVTLNREFLYRIAEQCGCSQQTLNKIPTLNMARELWSDIPEHDRRKFLPEIIKLCHRQCSMLIPTCEVEALLISDAGEISYTVK